MTGDVVGAWMNALRERHVEPLGRPAFLKAVRALSVRYVERRHTLSGRSAIDSAGKRAAFAAFYAPVHFATTRMLVEILELHDARIDTIVDLGCGTGVAGAAWALALPNHAALRGIDVNPWSVNETNWTWRTLGLKGHARRGDVVKTILSMRQVSRRSSCAGTAIVLGWTVNELRDDARRTLLPALLDLARQDASVLVIEPIARRAAPWWDEWATTFGEARGVAQNWEMALDGSDGGPLSGDFADLHYDAGFRRESLSVRSLSIAGR
ncbi:MAG: methyltransferase [Acidobacteriota bacterium]